MENIKHYTVKAFPPNNINFYRRYSLAQKVRRDLLRLIIYKPNLEKEIDNLKKQFQNFINIKFKNINELISYDLKDNFTNYFHDHHKTKKIEINPTIEALKLIKLFEKIDNPALSIYIHGSHADGHVTNYSDLDVSISINNFQKDMDLKRIRNDILIINNHVKQIDLESHHSIFLYLDSDFNCYPEGFMPINVLKNSVTPKEQKLNFGNVRFSTDIAIDSFLRISSSINKMTSQINNNNFYNIKFIISSYFMLIILNYEILNVKYTDKKTIFSEFLLNCTDKKFLNIFKLCSEIRQNWPKQIDNIDFGISNYIITNIQTHSKYMLEEIEKSSSLKKTIDIVSNS